ncbi:hypothetical protein [Nocardioides sp. cx-173]|uniref:hypothetical protein n=1 Tax=Nocardioides sp. cx-173 TaxID=2898796 RepID=UPI001E58EC3B|nr:hypothetical protein [Nocardioides sp. cx-173]MCD4526088.1 hypothetical protein [Nocardioides sp. cx-173]UGB43778.1 hypothetical protein LQ940_09720 [Nocardioides sp. cx-173]
MTRRCGIALVLLLTLLAAGCGEDDPFAGYCAEVSAQQKSLSEAFAGRGPTALIDALPSFEALREEAPRDIEDDWKVLVASVDTLVEALEEADVDPATYDATKPPAGLSAEERSAIEAAATELAGPATRAALAAVDQQSRDVCQTPLYL